MGWGAAVFASASPAFFAQAAHLARAAFRGFVGGLCAVAVVYAIAGCAAERPVGRDACYVDAQAAALADTLRWCRGYESTAACPAWPGIDDAHRRAQEACP